MIEQVGHAAANPLNITVTGSVTDVLDTARMGGADWATFQAFAKSGTWTPANAVFTIQGTNFDPFEETGWTALATSVTVTGPGITDPFPVSGIRYLRAICTTAAATETASVYAALTAYKEFGNGN